MAITFQYQARPTVPLTAATLPVTVAGMAWFKAWEPPYFPTRFKTELQDTETRQIAPPPPPAGVSGIAWMKTWEPPSFRGVPVERQPATQWPAKVPIPQPVGVSGIAFVEQWKPPYFPKVTLFYLQPAEMKGVLLASTLPPVPVRPTRRKPLLTQATNTPGGGYPPNYWRGQTD